MAVETSESFETAFLKALRQPEPSLLTTSLVPTTDQGDPVNYENDDSVDVDDVIETHWPYDGPHSDQKVKDAASMVSGLVRYMNNATHRPMRYAASANGVLGALTGAVYGLDQLTGQLARTLEHHAQDLSLYDDRRDRTGHQTALAAALQLGNARHAIAQLADALAAVREHTNHLGNETPDRAED